MVDHKKQDPRRKQPSKSKIDHSPSKQAQLCPVFNHLLLPEDTTFVRLIKYYMLDDGTVLHHPLYVGNKYGVHGGLIKLRNNKACVVYNRWTLKKWRSLEFWPEKKGVFALIFDNRRSLNKPGVRVRLSLDHLKKIRIRGLDNKDIPAKDFTYEKYYYGILEDKGILAFKRGYEYKHITYETKDPSKKEKVVHK
jgi:hypothetical protein